MAILAAWALRDLDHKRSEGGDRQAIREGVLFVRSFPDIIGQAERFPIGYIDIAGEITAKDAAPQADLDNLLANIDELIN